MKQEINITDQSQLRDDHSCLFTDEQFVTPPTTYLLTAGEKIDNHSHSHHSHRPQ